MIKIIVLLTLYSQPVLDVQEGIASYYTVGSSSTLTASGEPMIDEAFTCAMLKGNFGTYYLVENDRGGSVVVRLNDRGPYVHGRIIDLSEAAMRRLNGMRAGLLTVRIRPIHSLIQSLNYL